jgi:uncharacterized damage-inducible protein DinB
MGLFCRKVQLSLARIIPPTIPPKEEEMSFGVVNLIASLRSSRETFLKHLKDLRDDQWTWKPYPECKSIAETLAHLISNDRAALQSLETGREPDYASLQESERDPKRLLEMMGETRNRLIAYIEQKFAGAPLDAEVSLFGMRMSLASALLMLNCEEYYHAGQVAFIRMVTDPGWDYYAAVYGG